MLKSFDNAIYHSIVEQSVDAVIVINRSGDIVSWNASAERVFGYTSSEVIGKYVHDILPAVDLREKANESFCKFKKKGTGPLVGKILQVRGRKKNGEEVHVQFSFNTVEVEGELFAFAFIRDISELILLQEKLRNQATIDDLTGILNRRSYIERAGIAFDMSVRHKEPFTLLMMDIDFFKKINDQYGHLIGDIALKEFTHNISKIIRTEDIFARIGGEEFILALIKTPIDIASSLAERIRFATENLTINTSNLSFKLTVSIGISSIEIDDQSLEQVQSRSDVALYEAKKSGRNCIILNVSK